MPAAASSPISKKHDFHKKISVKTTSRTPARKTPVRAAPATKKTEKKAIELSILSSPGKKKISFQKNNNNKTPGSPASPSSSPKTKKSTPIQKIVNNNNNNNNSSGSDSDETSLPISSPPPLPFIIRNSSGQSNNNFTNGHINDTFESNVGVVPPTVYFQDLPLQQKQLVEKGVAIDPSFVYHGRHPHGELGLGSTQFPFRQPLRGGASPNKSGCFHCPSDTCICEEFADLMQSSIAACEMRRETDGRPGRKDLCAKSLEPNFVARLIREMNIESGDTFFDFGSGNGSILFQVAAQVPGVKCIGVELNSHNAELSRRLWQNIQPAGLTKLHQKFNSLPNNSNNNSSNSFSLEIIAGDALDLVSHKDFWKNATNKRTGKGPVILCNNVLWPRPTTHFLQEHCRNAPLNTRICCFDDFFPHGRAVCQSRDPEAFELFEMNDYFWPLGAVEWSPSFEGRFFIHRKIRNREDL